MDTLRTLMIGALLGAPLVAWGLCWLEEQLTRRALLNIARLAGIVALLSTCGLSFAARSSDGSVIEFAIMSWLRMPGFEVTLGGRFDGLACAQLTLTSVVLLLVLSVWPQQVSLRWLMLAWFGVTLSNVAGNFGQMFLGWTLSAWASSELARHPVKALRPVWLVQRIADVALVVGIGIAWMNFDSSLEFAAWTPDRIGGLRPELVEGIALCFLVGVIGRCAQLPLTVWLETEAGFASQSGNSMTKLTDEMVGLWNVPDGHHVAERLKSDPANRWHESQVDSIPPAVMGWWLCAAFLPVGIGLMVRLEPLLAAAPHTRLLMLAVGAFTLLMCSASAAAQNNWSGVLSQLAVGQCGLVLAAIGLDDRSGGVFGSFALVWQSVLFAALFVASSLRASRAMPVAGVVSLLLACGIWGRQSVADLVWNQVQPIVELSRVSTTDAERIVLGTTASRLLPLILALLCVSELLFSFALFRAWFSERRIAAQRADANGESTALIGIWLATVLMVVGGIWLCSDFELWKSLSANSIVTHDGAKTSFEFFASGLLWPLSAAGIVLAWWMYSKPSALPEKMFAAMGPFGRLSRNRFYWDDLYFLLIVHPAALIGDWLKWIDERALGYGGRAVRARLLRSLGDAAEPLVAESAVIGALTTLSSVAVFVWMMLWLRS